MLQAHFEKLEITSAEAITNLSLTQPGPVILHPDDRRIYELRNLLLLQDLNSLPPVLPAESITRTQHENKIFCKSIDDRFASQTLKLVEEKEKLAAKEEIVENLECWLKNQDTDITEVLRDPKLLLKLVNNESNPVGSRLLLKYALDAYDRLHLESDAGNTIT